MMIQANNIKTMLFSILCICFIFYVFLGIYSYMQDKKSKVNISFVILCICGSLWALGYAFMLISSNIETANIWRSIAVFGGCFFNAVWLSFAFSLNTIYYKKSIFKIQLFVYITSIIFFINTLTYEPAQIISHESYGFIDNFYIYTTTVSGILYSIYVVILFIAANGIIYFTMKNSQKNRIRKQMRIILIMTLISFSLMLALQITSDALGIAAFPYGSITTSISMGGMWYAINKYKMMSISYELVSEYIFEAVNEPIFLLDEYFFIKNYNEASLNIIGHNYKDLDGSLLNTIIDFKDFNFKTIMETGEINYIEVNLLKENKEALICELSATVIYDEYEDVLGILILLHDISERLLAEDKIRHFVYYDTLTELYNRKKMQEDVNILIDNKKEKFAVLFMDLDKFKSANDNYGHLAGDSVLKIAALRLKSVIRPLDTIYRIGGDEFIIILRNLKEIESAEKVAVAVKNVLKAAFIYKENQIFIGACIGISIFPEHGIDEDTLIKKADLAMYEIKRKGGNGYKLYSNIFEVPTIES